LALFTREVEGQRKLPKKVWRDYVDQLTAEVREEKEGSRGRTKVLRLQNRRDNHYLHCELMFNPGAVISRYLGSLMMPEAAA
jgi:hypothetical protein